MSSLPGSTYVGRIGLVVNDLEAVVAFYRDVIGLTVLSREASEVVLGAGGTPHLLLVEDADAPERPGESAGLYHVAVRVPTRAALGEALKRIREEWRLEGASDHLVSEALYLSDPEGNGVEVYRDRPRETWHHTDEGRVEMDTLPLDLSDLAAASEGGQSNEGHDTPPPDRGSGEVDRPLGQSTVPPETTVGHVHLEVTSLDDARAFYADALGLGIRQEFGDSALFLAAGGYHHHVGANTWRGRTEPIEGRGLDWFELVVPDRDAIADLRERLSERGVDVSGDESGIRVRDPDGIEVRVHEEAR